jgi:hypothetical protein
MLTDASSAQEMPFRMRAKAVLALSLTIALGLMLAFALDVVIPRLAFPFLDQSVSDTWLAMPWVVLATTVCLLWRRETRKLADRCVTVTVAIVPAYLLGILATHAVNAVGDRGPTRTAAYEVVGFTHGRSSTYARLDPLVGDRQMATARGLHRCVDP